MSPARALTSEDLQRAGLALAAFAVAYALSALRIGHGAPDFYVFWTAAQHGQAPYDPAPIAALEASLHLKGVWPFAYPPTFLLLVRPFALLPLHIAYPLWTGLSAAVFLHAAAHVVKPAWAAAILALSPVVFFSAELGQTSLLVGAAMLTGWRWRDARPALAGLLFGLAACIKPQAMILAPVILWGRWRMLAWMALAGVGLVLASCLAFGAERWVEWRGALAAFGALVPGADRANPSALIAGPWWAAAMAAFGLCFALASRNLVGLVGGAFCLTPYAHAYDLAPLTPLAAAWLFDRRQYGWGRAAAGGALLAGVVATPASVLAFLVALAALGLRWRTWRLERPTLSPAVRP
jgi:hypothetical protein